MHAVGLNVFQRTQRLWDTLHPYNAAQAAVLSADFGRDAIESAFNQAIHDLRLGTFVCLGNRYWIDRGSGARTCVAQVGDLAQHVSAEMNRAFDPLVSLPFRPFTGREPRGQAIGVVYQHWVADSASIRMLMRAWLARLLDRPDLRPPPIRLDAVGLHGRFGPASGGWSVMSQLAELPVFAREMKHTRRVPPNGASHDVAAMMLTLPDGLIGRLLRASRARGVTVGDVFLAAAAEACARHAPNLPTTRRPNLAMGTIVDLRPRHPQIPGNIFALLLGFMVSTFTHRHLYDFDALLHRTHSLRRSQSHRKSPEASQLRMQIGLWISRFVDHRTMLDFYRRRFPLAGGLSNVNLTPEWGPLHPDPLVAYHRISPTGPLMPIVLTPSTLGDTLSLCCTYRTALAEHGEAQAVVNSFVKRIETFAG